MPCSNSDDDSTFPAEVDGQFTHVGSSDELTKRLAKIKSEEFLNVDTAVFLAYILTRFCMTVLAVHLVYL